jgi:hypothetical protein
VVLKLLLDYSSYNCVLLAKTLFIVILVHLFVVVVAGVKVSLLQPTIAILKVSGLTALDVTNIKIEILLLWHGHVVFVMTDVIWQVNVDFFVTAEDFIPLIGVHLSFWLALKRYLTLLITTVLLGVLGF